MLQQGGGVGVRQPFSAEDEALAQHDMMKCLMSGRALLPGGSRIFVLRTPTEIRTRFGKSVGIL